MAGRLSAAGRVARDDERRVKKNAALNAWRQKNRARYNAYIRDWRAKRKAQVEEARRVLAQAAPRAEKNVVSTRTTTVEIDEAKLAEAMSILGTRTLRATVDRAFDEVLARDAREKSIARLQSMDGLDLDKPEVMAKAWR
jgi:Arc/MetJ family transcription regulator